MEPSLQGFPSREEGLALHLRLRDLDPAAVAEVCRAYLNPLLGRLAVRFPRVDPHVRQSAAHDALFTYVRSPQVYDPNRGDLASYLRMATRCDLVNLLQGEAKHQRGRVGWAVVEHAAEGGNLLGEEEPSLQLLHAEESRQWRSFLDGLVESFTDPERGVLALMLAGERNTRAYALALGKEGLAAAEQEREVKRVKDRIKKRLERGAPSHA